MSEPYFGLESFSRLAFADFQQRLISFVVAKIRNGEFTERGLARVLGVSQPQLHNVLKGARPLKPEFADCLLRQFEIGLLDLVHRSELAAMLERSQLQQGRFWLESKQRGEECAPSRKSSGKERAGVSTERLAG
jgi:plasmid maintenance system antidote protein VapI